MVRAVPYYTTTGVNGNDEAEELFVDFPETVSITIGKGCSDDKIRELRRARAAKQAD